MSDYRPGCTGKPKYGDESTALAATQRGASKKWTADGRKKTPMYAYKCPFCHFWHLTHMSPEEGARGIAVAAARRANNAAVVERIRRRG